jgi:hypothetical protein
VEGGYRNQLDSEIGNVRDDALTSSHGMYITIANRQAFSATLFSSTMENLSSLRVYRRKNRIFMGHQPFA